MAGIACIHPLPQPGLSSILSTKCLFSCKGIFQTHVKLPHKAAGCQGQDSTRFSEVQEMLQKNMNGYKPSCPPVFLAAIS